MYDRIDSAKLLNDYRGVVLSEIEMAERKNARVDNRGELAGCHCWCYRLVFVGLAVVRAKTIWTKMG